MSDRYCVFGNPIEHSKSPLIHTEFAQQTKQDIEYTKERAPLDGFADAWQSFVEKGGRGANVTVPFKGDAFALCDTLSKRAQRAKAVNTLTVGGNGQVYGDNTDGVGLIRDLKYHRVPLTDKRVLVIGAGGAVRGALEPLLAEQPSEVVLVNRTAEKAQQLADDFADLGELHSGGFKAIKGPFDVVINGSSASLNGELPPLPGNLFTEGAWAYDMMYGAVQTVFLKWAGTHGAKRLDGLGMLVEQAAEAFFLWRNVRPDTTQVRQIIRRMLNAA
ncbi:shikimate dehydrogenase [Vreelandella zhanjiangensis]|uniref:shikimate dehydrogenase n=1 Tax=Vreelandella zhanjiangensis TaxID=1121960 RepID=UPI00402A8039